MGYFVPRSKNENRMPVWQQRAIRWAGLFLTFTYTLFTAPPVLFSIPNLFNGRIQGSLRISMVLWFIVSVFIPPIVLIGLKLKWPFKILVIGLILTVITAFFLYVPMRGYAGGLPNLYY